MSPSGLRSIDMLKYLVVVTCGQGYETDATLFDNEQEALALAQKSNNKWSSSVVIYTVTNENVLKDVPQQRG